MLILFLLVGCAKKENNYLQEDYIVGMWLSYAEVDRLLTGDFKKDYAVVLNDCKRVGVTDIFVHVRAFCDSIYPSELFPLRETAVKDFDVLEAMIKLTHDAGIRFHAWINPYRVRVGDEDITKLDKASPARIWSEDSTAKNNVCFWNGIYLNPSSYEVRRLIIDGIREVLRKYKVDGIHFDDYFYPTVEPDFDSQSYSDYVASVNEPLGLAEWRRANVNQLISSVYTAVKFFDNDLIFSVSPTASIENNKEKLFADVEVWVENGCVDWIVPQLYFGFEYPDDEFQFDNLLVDWLKIKRGEDVKIIVGLAAYKMDETQAVDFREWQENTDILSREAAICRKEKDISGHAYYSYTSLFQNASVNKKALSELLTAEKQFIK